MPQKHLWILSRSRQTCGKGHTIYICCVDFQKHVSDTLLPWLLKKQPVF